MIEVLTKKAVALLVLKLYPQTSYAVLAEELGCKQGTLSYWAREAGAPLRRRRLSPRATQEG